jgi:hypothetical protein
MVSAMMFVLAIFVSTATSLIMVIHALALQQHRPGCSVAFPWHTSVGTLVDGD